MTPAFPACFVGDLIAMTRKNLAISPLEPLWLFGRSVHLFSGK
jgi:hypothetical protein